jgi:hypothetical protein
VKNLNKKTSILIIVIFSILSLVSLANAQEPRRITVWADKSEYALGETGILYIVFYNDETDAVELEKIIVIFEHWRAYKNDQWEGNKTLEINKSVVSKGIYATETSFTVPNDGRAVSTIVDVIVRTEDGDIYIPVLQKPSISVAETPRHIKQIVTLFTIQVVLTIVCTIIISGTIFLSSGRPKIIWKKEESEKEKQ